MEITVKRTTKTENSTIGELLIEGQFFCFTLEDVVRELGVKVPGKTAIPEGRYQVIIDYSSRFKRLMPHILNVPMFDGVRIHAGNTAADTEGCLLLGDTKGDDVVGLSRHAYDRFFPLLEKGVAEGDVFITICEGNNAV